MNYLSKLTKKILKSSPFSELLKHEPEKARSFIVFFLEIIAEKQTDLILTYRCFLSAQKVVKRSQRTKIRKYVIFKNFYGFEFQTQEAL